MPENHREIRAASKRLNQGTHSLGDVQQMTKVISDRGGVAAGRDITGNTIYAGSNIVLTPEAIEVLLPVYRPPELPKLGETPERGDLPPGSRLPFPPNSVFTGRNEDLLGLAQTLLYSDAKSVVATQEAAVATGFGGIGKTQLAVEFSYRYGRFFQCVHWIHADQDIPAEIAECGAAMVLPFWPDRVPDQVALTLRYWQERGPRLVVLDNVANPSILQEWMPQLPRCRVLVTSRQAEWPPDLGLEIRSLDVLPRLKSRELLCKLAPRLRTVHDKTLDDIAERLGDMPLALDLSGRYLADRSRFSPEVYFSSLKEVGSAMRHPSLKDWVTHSPTRHKTGLASTFIMSWEQLGADDPADNLAKRIFRACGYCAPSTPIPQNLLGLAVNLNDSSDLFDLAIGRLSNLGLIISTENGPSLHPLIAEFARMLDKESRTSVLPNLAKALAELATHANTKGFPEISKPLREHLQHVAEAIEGEEPEIAGWLWSELGFHLRTVAEFVKAKRCFEKALSIDEDCHGPNHPNVALDINYLGLILRDLGDLEGARKNYERSLKIYEKLYGPEHHEIAQIFDDLGGVLRVMGKLEEARDIRERALKINERSYGPNHPKVAAAINNLGNVFLDLNDLHKARECYERALKISEKVFGVDHPQVGINLNNVGTVLRYSGDLQAAMICFKRSLDIEERAYGSNHPTVARTLNNIGAVLKELGELQNAKDQFERALMIDERVYGPNNPIVAVSANNLGLILQDMGDFKHAREYVERALEIDEKIYGSDHPIVGKNVHNLVCILLDLGEPQIAKECFEKSLRIFQKHPEENRSIISIISHNLKSIGV